MIRTALTVLLVAGAVLPSPEAASQVPPPSASNESPQPVFKVPVGWRVKILRGEEPRYCRKDVRLGSRFAKEECLTRDQLELRLQLEADNVSRVSQGAQICTSAPGCVNY